MALATSAFKAALKAAFAANLPGITAEQDAALDTTCDAIAAATEAYIMTATVNYVSGLANGGGAVTGVMISTIT